MTLSTMISPAEWIQQRTGAILPARPPVIYVAAPVAPQKNETLATCLQCAAENTFGPGDAVDLHLVCNCNEPVSQNREPAAIVAFNCRRALRWWRWLHLGIVDVTWIMPWYVGVMASDDGDPVLRERGIRDCMNVARRCDAIMACGPRISSGMMREAKAVAEGGGELFQLEGFAREPARINVPLAVPWRRWFA